MRLNGAAAQVDLRISSAAAFFAGNRLRELSNAVIIVRKERAFAGLGAEAWDQKD